jgi:hypothetical protein
MPATVDLTEALILTSLRAVLLDLIAPGTEVIRTEINRVAEPKGPDFVTLTPTGRERLSTDVVSYDFTAGTMLLRQATEIIVAVDIHGPNSADNAQIVSTVFRDAAGCDAFAATGRDVTPLYAGEPHQSPFQNAENQIEWRWTVELHLQANPVVTLPMQSALAVNIGLISVDERYPPGA